MFPSIYLNCSDAPQALYPQIKKLLLFTDEVHIMNPNPLLLEKYGQISPGEFLKLCGDGHNGEQSAIRPMCRESFIDKTLRRNRVDLASQDYDDTFFKHLSVICKESGRILDEASYEPARLWTAETFTGLGEKSFKNIASLTQQWLKYIPSNRVARMHSVAEACGKSLEWIFVDTIHQELYLKANSGAKEHTPTPIDAQALMYLNALETSKVSRNFVAMPSFSTDRSQKLIALINELFPIDMWTHEQLSQASADDIFAFRRQHRREIDTLTNEIWDRAWREHRDPIEVGRDYANEREEEIKSVVRKVIAGAPLLAHLIDLVAGNYFEVIRALSDVGELLAVYEFLPRVQSAVNSSVRHLAPGERKIVFSSYLFLDTIGQVRDRPPNQVF